MRFFKLFFAIAFLLISFNASAQRPGFQAYQCVGCVYDGQRQDCNYTLYLKFEGDLLFIDSGVVNQRFVYSGTQSNGNLLYYLQAWNNGTMNQGSGWSVNKNSYVIVSPDKRHINESTVFMGKTTTYIYNIQTADSAGDMIY